MVMSPKRGSRKRKTPEENGTDYPTAGQSVEENLNKDVFEKSQALLVDDLQRCCALGLNMYNFHPGSSLRAITTEQCVGKIAQTINQAHQQAPATVTSKLESLLSTRRNPKLVFYDFFTIWSQNINLTMF